MSTHELVPPREETVTIYERSKEGRRAPPRLGALVDQLHQAATSASTSASRSMSAGVRFSVTQTRRASSSPA